MKPARHKRASAKARPRPVPGSMNKLEAKYASELKSRLNKGEIEWWSFEPFRLRLAEGCFYVPDFVVLHPDGEIEIVEVKGRWYDGAKEKVKVAANRFWYFRFTVVFPIPKKSGGGWRTETYRGGYD